MKKSKKLIKRSSRRSKTKTKRNKKNYKKRLQKGGFSDTRFLDCYEKNLENIQKALTQYSGKHAIDNTNSNLFIENQLSEVRRQAARDLIENTTYITLEDTFKILEQLIITLYGMPEIQNAKNIYIYSGIEKKSFYFLSVLALYYIRNHSYKEPIFIKQLNNELFDEIGEDPLIILDDASYSASQLSEMLNNIYYDRVVTKKNKVPNIFVTLLALNDFSKSRLERVPTERDRWGTRAETVSPFKLVYLPERLYQPMILKIGIERYFYLNYYFSLFTQDMPHISLYFDHKIADDISTYKKPLLYGPIVPSTYTPSKVMNELETSFDDYDIICEELYKNTELVKTLLKQFADENKNAKVYDISTRRSAISSSIAYFLLEKLEQADKCDQTIDTISFYPVISNCNKNPQLMMNIQDPNIINCDYLLFMIPEGCLTKNKKKQLADCSVKPEPIPDSLITKNNIEINNKINSVVCPETWYKNGILKMECPT